MRERKKGIEGWERNEGRKREEGRRDKKGREEGRGRFLREILRDFEREAFTQPNHQGMDSPLLREWKKGELPTASSPLSWKN